MSGVFKWAFEKTKESLKSVKENSLALKDSVIGNEDKTIIEELLSDNKNLKNTILELIKEKEELEEKIETLEMLE